MASVETTRRAGGEGMRLAAWSVGALVVALLRDRLWATPNLAFFLSITRHLGANPFPKSLDGGDYLLTNLTGPVLARALGLTSPEAYVRLHLAVLLVGLAAVTVAAFRRFGYRPARALVWILAASPVVTVCLQWLGQPDVFTLPLALALALSRRRWTSFAFAVLLGLTHFEQGLFAALAAVVAHHLLDSDDPAADAGPDSGRGAWWRPMVMWTGALVGGVVVGRAVTEVYLQVGDIVIRKPRTSYLDLGVSGFWHEHTVSPLTLLYSLWGPLWLVMGWLAWRWWRGGHSFGPVPIVGLTSLVALGPVAVTLDETRVYALITAPLLLVLAILLTSPELVAPRYPGGTSAQPVRGRLAALVAIAVLALAVVPGEFSAGGSSWAVALPPGEFAHFLWDGTVPGGVDQLSPWLLHPFHFKVPATP